MRRLTAQGPAVNIGNSPKASATTCRPVWPVWPIWLNPRCTPPCPPSLRLVIGPAEAAEAAARQLAGTLEVTLLADAASGGGAALSVGSHPAFQGAAAKRLKMCSDRRVIDLASQTRAVRITDL